MDQAGTFAAVAVALYAAHHVGDYWVQTDHQARHKGEVGSDGRWACVAHVTTYLLTQATFMAGAALILDIPGQGAGPYMALLVSGVTHYMADRREHGLMFKLARRLPGKAAFLELGKPRKREPLDVLRADGFTPVMLVRDDNPQLATGAWALDQSWHIFWGVFVAALLVVAL